MGVHLLIGDDESILRSKAHDLVDRANCGRWHMRDGRMLDQDLFV